jgi:protein-disulfide isomerase
LCRLICHRASSALVCALTLFLTLSAPSFSSAAESAATPSLAAKPSTSTSSSPGERAAPTFRTSTTPTVTIRAHRPCNSEGNRDDVVACVGEHAITLREVDEAAGHAVETARDRLYALRAGALYQLITKDLLEEEARAEHVTVDQLLERHVTSSVKPVTDAEVQAFLHDHATGVENPPRTREAALYLDLKRNADAKRAYVEKLYKARGVEVHLEAPPAPAPEVVRGPLTPSIGAPDAPTTLVVFSDYLCPYCRTLSHTVDQLLAQYPHDVRVVYRHFPIHSGADTLAEGALCADEQGRFASFHHLLFEQTSDRESVADIAAKAGLDTTAFADCLSSHRFRARVEADLAEGQRLGIEGTPTLFVNGQRLQGIQSLEKLRAQVVHENVSPPTAGFVSGTLHGADISP